ncbi:aromatic acid exporter family protein [Geodermatophilus sp. SYSU D01180]
MGSRTAVRIPGTGARTGELLRRPWVQRAVRAALAAALAWQVAVLLPPPFTQYAYYAPLGAVIAVHPTVADSAAAAWRTVLAILLGFGLGVTVHQLTAEALPGTLTIALIVALAVGVEQWRVLQEHASWVSFAAVLMLTVGTAADPARYAVAYAGLTLLGAATGVLVTTVLFPPMQLTAAVRAIATTRALLARHLHDIAGGLRHGELPAPGAWARPRRDLDAALDRMRAAEAVVERARRANPRARRWGGTAARVREESRALDRVAVLVDDLTTLVAHLPPDRRGIDRIDGGTGWLLADALDGLALVVSAGSAAGEDDAVREAGAALRRLTALLRASTAADDEGFVALGAVAVGMYRSLDTLQARPRREGPVHLPRTPRPGQRVPGDA